MTTKTKRRPAKGSPERLVRNPEDRRHMPYVLPNGLILKPGGRIRVPKEVAWKIPSQDIYRYGIDLEDRKMSAASEVLTRPYIPNDKPSNRGSENE